MAGQHAAWKSMIFLIAAVAAAAIGTCNGEVYRVGDETGWTVRNNDTKYYEKWASSKSFKVGDTLLFEYDNFWQNLIFHDLVRVTRENFDNCNATSPYGMRRSGNDSFLLNRPGYFYFICGVPGDCENGQRVKIWVSGGRAPEPSPSPSNSVQSSAHSPSSVGPSASEPTAPTTENNGAASAEWSWKILVAGVVAVAAAGFY